MIACTTVKRSPEKEINLKSEKKNIFLHHCEESHKIKRCPNFFIVQPSQPVKTQILCFFLLPPGFWILRIHEKEINITLAQFGVATGNGWNFKLWSRGL